MGAPHDLTAVEQAAAVRRREVSPRDLVEHYLERIDRLNDNVGAFVTLMPDQARAAAEDAERRVREADDPGALPPLLGVAIAIKDLADVAGVRGMLGSAVFADRVAEEDAPVVAALRRAGAIVVGKTNVPEFGLTCYTEPDVAPPARTPWDTRLSAGGSSGGSAAAVAAGLAAVAQGSDGGGSVRIPASLCGLVGLKTSRGRVDNGGASWDEAGLVCQGPLARTVADAALWLDAVASQTRAGPRALPPPASSFLEAASRDPGSLRIARYREPVLADVRVDPVCIAAYEEVSRVLEDLGHEVVDVPAPDGERLLAVFTPIWAVLAARVDVPTASEHRLRPLTRWLRDAGRGVSAHEYASALAKLRRESHLILSALEPFDAVLTPTLAAPPLPVGALRDDADPAGDFAAQTAFTPFGSVANLTGQPAISLPVGWTDDGLPVGVMLAGRPAGEEALLALAAQIEAAMTGPSPRRPPLW